MNDANPGGFGMLNDSRGKRQSFGVYQQKAAA
jgi:hypothetical protein